MDELFKECISISTPLFIVQAKYGFGKFGFCFTPRNIDGKKRKFSSPDTIFKTFNIYLISKYQQSQGLLYKHRCHSFSHLVGQDHVLK